MNFITFINISRYLIRNLNAHYTKQFVAINKRILRTINPVPESSIVTLNSKSVTGKKQRDNRRDENFQDICDNLNNTKDQNLPIIGGLLSAAISFSLFGKSKEAEETPEEKLINTIKRSVLCIQNEQYEKAEQILHLALRMAQEIQSDSGITYIYDVMANLAMEREQFKKAEKIFAEVMKRLFAEGHDQNSPQILHISSKLAHIAQLQGDLDKALQGFTWTLSKIEDTLRNTPEDKDIQELLGLTKNWFGQLLLKQGKYNDAKKCFEEAHDCLVEIYGRVNEAAVTILNNISVACTNLEDYHGARANILQALDIAKELKDVAQEGILQANLGLIYLREGLITQAQENCSLAYRIGKKYKNPDAIEQAEYCLNEIKSFSS